MGMTDHEVLEALRAWDENDRAFRDVARMLAGEITRDELFRRWPADHESIRYALYPEKRPDVVPAAYLLGNDRNVAINRHPRYSVAAKHSHDFFELNYVLEGLCTQHFEDGKARLSAGDFCMLSPDAVHCITTDDEDTIVLNIGIRQSSFVRRFTALPRQDSAISRFFMDNLYSKKKLRYLLVHTAGDPAVRHAVLQMVAEELNRDRYSDDILVASASILFSLLLRSYGDRMEAPPLRQTQNVLTAEMLGYIHEHYAEVTLSRLAEAFHYTRQYCSKLIRELTGESASELIAKVKVGYGEAMLRDTFLSVEEISGKVGYANPETFIRVFRRVKGMTPTQYRKMAGI